MKNGLHQNSMKKCLIFSCCLVWATSSLAVNPPYTTDTLNVKFEGFADGTYLQTEQACLIADAPDEVGFIGKQTFPYYGERDTFNVEEAYTVTPDGRRVEVPSANVKHQDQADQNATGFGSTKQVVVVFPEVSEGSKLCFRVQRKRTKSILRNGLEWNYLVYPFEVIKEGTIELVLHDTQAHVAGIRIEGGVVEKTAELTRYRYKFKNESRKFKENSELEWTTYAPRVWVSNHRDWATLAAEWKSIYNARSMPTVEMVAVAEKVTRGIVDPAEQIEALYLWVVNQIRYVSISEGDHGWVPQSVEETLIKRYGDCKAKSVLLTALLKSRGIEATPVFVDTRYDYEPPPVPTTNVYNHVVVFIPKYGYYLDPTDQFSRPPVNLDFVLRGKPIFDISAGVIRYTPVLPMSQNTAVTETELTLNPDGSFTGTSKDTYTGAIENYLRREAFSSLATPREDQVNTALLERQESGTGTTSRPDPVAVDKAWITESGFRLDPMSPMPGPGAFRIPTGLSSPLLLWASTTDLESRPKTRPFTCLPKVIEQRTTIHLPVDLKLYAIPRDTKVEGGRFAYTSAYKREGQTISAYRRWSISGGNVVCQAADYASMEASVRAIRQDLRQQVIYE